MEEYNNENEVIKKKLEIILREAIKKETPKHYVRKRLFLVRDKARNTIYLKIKYQCGKRERIKNLIITSEGAKRVKDFNEYIDFLLHLKYEDIDKPIVGNLDFDDFDLDDTDCDSLDLDD